MKKLPLTDGEVDPKKCTLEQNLERMQPLLATLKAALASQSLSAAQAAAGDLRRAAWAIEEQLYGISQHARSVERALTLSRKDPA